MACTAVQRPTSTEVKHTEVQKIIRDYHAIMNTVIGTAVVIGRDNDNLFVYNDDPR